MKRRNFVSYGLSIPLLPVFFENATADTFGFAPTSIVNSGVGGNNTVEILERIDKDCLSHQPDLTVLMAGTNDMNSRKFIPLDSYEKNMRTIIASILKIKSKIVLMNLLPVYEPYLMTRHSPEFYKPEGHKGRLMQMNSLIEKLAKAYDLYFLDIHHVFDTIGSVGLDAASLIRNEANSNATDGVHPTSEGYRIMGLAVYQHIINHKLPRAKIVCLGDSITKGDGNIDGQNYPAYLKKLFS